MNVERAVLQAFAHAAGVPMGAINPNSTVTSLAIPSLDALEMLFDLEEEFDLQLGEHDIDLGTATVNDLIVAIENALKRKHVAPLRAVS